MPKYEVEVLWYATSEGIEYLEVEADSELEAREWAMDNIDPDITRDVDVEVIDVISNIADETVNA